MEAPDNNSILRQQNNWQTLYFYQKSQALYQLTFEFTKRFLTRGDRTIDQMVQAARSGKQNIVEGFADGVASTEIELKLLNVARSSIKELREDFEDYLTSRHLTIWTNDHPRYGRLQEFCKYHNKLDDYQPYFQRWSEEEMANVGLSLCHYIDRMMTTYQKKMETDFIENGGIKERMSAARLGYRTNQKEEIETLQRQLAAARQELERLKKEEKP
jgi:four helix bundle suffix protein